MANPKNELSRYMEQVCKHPVLTREEELVLARKAKAGDKEALTKTNDLMMLAHKLNFHKACLMTLEDLKKEVTTE